MNKPPKELLARSLADLRDIAHELPLVYYDGYRPQGPRSLDHQARREAALNAGPDFVPGARFDTGVGSYKRKTAYREATRRIASVDRTLYTLLERKGIKQPRQAVFKNSGGLLTVDESLVVITTSQLRILLTARHWRELSKVKGVKRSVTAVAVACDSAWNVVTKSTLEGKADPDSQAVGEEDCRVCGIRPRRERHTRCHTCQRWWERNGYERPTTLDSHDDARDAQQRRLERGDGYGDESLTGTGIGKARLLRLSHIDRLALEAKEML